MNNQSPKRPARRRPNPYIAGAPIQDEAMFFGRNDIFETIRARLIGQHQDNIVVIFGQRRTGKTSVLYQMGRRLNADRERYVAVLVDLQGLKVDGMDNLLWGLARTIQRALRRDYQLRLSIPNRAAFQDDARGAFRDTFLPSLCEAIGERRLLLMFDETVRLEEAVSAGRLERGIFDYLRSLMQHERDLSFIFSLGSKLEHMQQEYALLFNVALNLTVSFLDEDSAHALVTEPVADLYTFDDSAVEHLLTLTSRHPYFTQLLCHALFTHWEQEDWSRVTSNEVDAVLDEAGSLAVANLQYVWNEASRAEKFVLAALAGMGPGEVDAAALGRRLRRAGVRLGRAEVAHALNSLARREVIISPAHPRFSVELIRRWLTREKPLAWVQEELRDLMPEPTYRGMADYAAQMVRRLWGKAERALGRTGLRVLGGASLTALAALAIWGIMAWVRFLKPINVPVIDTKLRFADGMPMVLVPEGSFLMGSDPERDPISQDWDHERPQHEVALSGFWIDQIEVTNEQYEECVQAGECAPSSFAHYLEFNGADYPVVGVDWENARAYCLWVGGDLPTEAQWEKTARGADGRIYPWGNKFDGAKVNSCDVNCPFTYRNQSYDDAYGRTAPADSFREGASPYGALNMSGNVQEWVLDWYSRDYYQESIGLDPTGPVSGTLRLLRGGSWGHSQSNNRSAHRGPVDPDTRDNFAGFRCAMSITPAPIPVAEVTLTAGASIISPTTPTATTTPTPSPTLSASFTETPTPSGGAIASSTPTLTPTPTPTPLPTPTPPLFGQFQLLWPIDGPRITQYFGDNPQLHAQFDQAGYQGLDFMAPVGSNVYAAYGGVVYDIRPDDGNPYGLHVRIKHVVNGREFQTIYAHLSQVLVTVDQQVEAGELIASSGATGYATGPVLSLALKIDGAQTPGYPEGYVDPLPYLQKEAETPTPTATPRPTSTPAPTLTPTQPAVSDELDFEAPEWVHSWEPQEDGQKKVTLMIQITGGTAPFTVTHEHNVAGLTSERDFSIEFMWAGECNPILYNITVESADGQSVSKDYWIGPERQPWCDES
ncbi:MAG: hypothetical protein B6I35_05540 [Anaerolineaceae bacterium 4572_32.2]|nr:MAG: hypothetical protein B6I35_05540 [Anaerolineaceae bacterium 4572_32.2]HEY72811.1 SUMF1/EgtB/PvdO family nonheme iron enzyme [Thermoflexia bacterium]